MFFFAKVDYTYMTIFVFYLYVLVKLLIFDILSVYGDIRTLSAESDKIEYYLFRPCNRSQCLSTRVCSLKRK